MLSNMMRCQLHRTRRSFEMPAMEPLVRPVFELERLEPRVLLTIVPIDATAGVPFDGLVATDLRLPANATGPTHINVMINEQWDYSPTAIARPDGTFDLHAHLTPQRAGTNVTSIWFRNELTGSWDLLESGEQTIRQNHFSATVADAHIYDRVPGTRFREPVATFTTSSLTQPFDNYVVEVSWFGQARTGRLLQQNDGTVAAFVDDAYLPLNESGDAITTIRLANAPDGAPPVGYARAFIASYPDIGIGMFYGSLTSQNDFRINLPNKRIEQGMPLAHFIPTFEIVGWTSTFTVELIWQSRDKDLGTSSGTVVRNRDGSYAILGTRPAHLDIDNGMIKITESVQRPPVDGQPAQTYSVTYVGSFSVEQEQNQSDPIPEIPPIDPPASIMPAPEAFSSIEVSSRVESIATAIFRSGGDTLLGSEDEVDVSALID